MASLQTAPARPRRFAPLRPDADTTDAPKLKGIVFDVDGTLCLPQHYMFPQMRSALGIDQKTDILEHIRNLPTEQARTDAVAKVQAIEREAMLAQQPQPGLVTLMDYLEKKGIRRALCTRNFEAPVTHLLKNHLPNHIFEPIVTRDTPDLLPKPEPSGLLHIAEQWGLDNRADSMIMVGDSIDDMTAGHTAGAATVLLVNERNTHLKEHVHTDMVFTAGQDGIGRLPCHDRGLYHHRVLEEEVEDSISLSKNFLAAVYN
ncbi:HAD superfamily hydrolase [Talaromyces pinophilus]|uniref:HAD superfamily hydrolase n=1 Tax=Talaromyces pinophilus TaxID=128442 RepID=A0A510NVS9_TALPI|nr:HAD superfamily hydrolase [Talaromyces pinophilus]